MTTDHELRVVTLGQSWPDDRPGGLNRYVADLHAALPGVGVRDELVVFGPAQAADERTHRAGPETAPLPVRLRAFAGAARWAGREAQLVASHFALYGVPAWLPPLRKLPHVAHFHGPWAQESAAQGQAGAGVRAKHVLEHHHLGTASAVITASRAFADLAVSTHGLPAPRVHAVHPGVDTSRFHPLPPAEREALRARLGIADGQHVVVTARRLVPRMGLEELLSVWDGARGARLVVLGDGPLRAALQRTAAGLEGVELPGRVSDADLVAWYQAADLVVVPSVSLEGFGLVVLEALACGTPVVASSVGGLGEVLGELGEHLLLAPQDRRAWAAAVSASRGADLPSRSECRAAALRHDTTRFAAEVYRSVTG